jgi:hypothetical protein
MLTIVEKLEPPLEATPAAGFFLSFFLNPVNESHAIFFTCFLHHKMSSAASAHSNHEEDMRVVCRSLHKFSTLDLHMYTFSALTQGHLEQCSK